MRQTRSWIPAMLLAVMMLAACAPPAAQPSAELAATTDAWETAFNAGDADSLKAMYAVDGKVMPPNGETIEGREGIAAVFNDMIAGGVTIDLETVEAIVAGDLGHKIGTYEIRAADGSVADRGKYVELWKLVDGAWLITGDIWNSDMPVDSGLATVVVTHEVKDAGRWLAAWRGSDSRRQLFAEHGAPAVRVLQSADKPELTGLLIEVADMEAFKAMLASPQGTTAKAEDGVKEKTIRMFREVE